MDLVGKAKRVRVYLNEDDRIGRMSAARVLVEYLRRENAQGATVVRGVEGFGATGEIHVSHLADIAQRLPVIVEWIDVAERVERLLPDIVGMVPRGLITVDDTEIVLYEPHPVRDLPKALSAGDAMSREVISVARDTPVRRIVELMLGKTYRTVPVVEGGVPVGIITSGDLVQRGGLGVRVDLLRSLDKPEIHSVLERLAQGNEVAGDVMTPGPVTVHVATPLPSVAEVMARRRLKRLPVVDDRGALVGMVSRVDLLRMAAGGFREGEEGPRELGLAGDTPLSRVMRRDMPVVHPDTPLSEVFQAIISTRLNRALVVDGERRVVGLVTDAELIDRLAPSLRPSALRSLMHRLPFSHATAAEQAAESHARARRAADLMTTDVPTARENALLSSAIGAMLKGSHKVLAVVDEGKRLVGIVDRADLLHGLVPRVD
jgi:CBS domain-containing protein/PII-like signaling protein